MVYETSGNLALFRVITLSHQATVSWMDTRLVAVATRSSEVWRRQVRKHINTLNWGQTDYICYESGCLDDISYHVIRVVILSIACTTVWTDPFWCGDLLSAVRWAHLAVATVGKYESSMLPLQASLCGFTKLVYTQSSHCSSFEDRVGVDLRVPDLQTSYSDLTRMRGH